MLEHSTTSSVTNNTSVAPLLQSEARTGTKCSQSRSSRPRRTKGSLLAESYLKNRQKFIALAASRGIADPEALVQGVYATSDGSPKSLRFIRHRFLCRLWTALKKQIREENHRFYLSEESLHQIGASKDHFEEIQRKDEVRSLLERLSPIHRQVLDLHHLEGRPLSEISQRIGRTEESVKKLLFEARKAARDVLLVLRNP